MFGIPEWAIGVGVIIFCIPAAIVLLRLVHPLLPPPPSRPSESDEIQQGQTLADVQARLGELEERVDFAERLLAEQREAQRLAPPQK